MVRLVTILIALAATIAPGPAPIGRLIDIGGRRLHLHCTGERQPTVVVETGLGDFSFDWVLVQQRVSAFARICTYDRAGYAWSDDGPTPRTFDQLNLELHDALARVGERGPFVLVGHSFGGGVVRRYTERYPDEVAGLVLAETVSEDQYIPMGPRAGLIRDDARGLKIPEPVAIFRSHPPAAAATQPARIEPPYDRLPPREQALHAWASSLPGLEAAEDSQKQWSAEYYARWSRAARKGMLGARPLVVLTRAHGGYGDGLGIPAAELERTRLDAQHALADLSTAGSQRIVDSGHNLHLEAPAEVERAIRAVVDAVRGKRR